MSIEDYVQNLFPPPDIHSGFDVGVQWQDAHRRWLVTITEPFKTESGEFELGPIWQGRYGELEAGTAYQALMLALSDWQRAT